MDNPLSLSNNSDRQTLEKDASAWVARRSAADLPRLVSPRELYELVPQTIEHDLALLNGCYYAHLPEVELRDLKQGENPRVEVRVIRHVDWDVRRFWRLATVWFDGEPVMVVKNAGREGDDHFGRFITDPARYWQMVAYLRSLMPPEPGKVDDEIVDPDEMRDDLTRFYGWDEGI